MVKSIILNIILKIDMVESIDTTKEFLNPAVYPPAEVLALYIPPEVLLEVYKLIGIWLCAHIRGYHVKKWKINTKDDIPCKC